MKSRSAWAAASVRPTPAVRSTDIIPRSGGNTFRGTAFTSLAGDWSRGDNLNDQLRGIGITETPGIIQAHDASIAYGASSATGCGSTGAIAT